MLNAVGFGLGVGAGIQAWRAWPPSSPVSPDALALVFCVGLVLVWFGGRSRRPSAVAVATAEATATATNTVQVAVFAGRDPERDLAGFSSAGGLRVPTDAAPWLADRGGASELLHLEEEEIRSILEEQGDTTT